MKNIVTIQRINDNARRIYELPENITLQRGTLVQVETRFGDRLYGITITDSAIIEPFDLPSRRSSSGNTVHTY